MEDEAIVSLYWQRSESAIRETEIKYDRYLSKIAYNILSDVEDSRESVNDTYLAAWNSMPPPTGPGSSAPIWARSPAGSPSMLFAAGPGRSGAARSMRSPSVNWETAFPGAIPRRKR